MKEKIKNLDLTCQFIEDFSLYIKQCYLVYVRSLECLIEEGLE